MSSYNVTTYFVDHKRTKQAIQLKYSCDARIKSCGLKFVYVCKNLKLATEAVVFKLLKKYVKLCMSGIILLNRICKRLNPTR